MFVFCKTSQLCADCVLVLTKISISWGTQLGWASGEIFERRLSTLFQMGPTKCLFILKCPLISFNFICFVIANKDISLKKRFLAVILVFSSNRLEGRQKLRNANFGHF